MDLFNILFLVCSIETQRFLVSSGKAGPEMEVWYYSGLDQPGDNMMWGTEYSRYWHGEDDSSLISLLFELDKYDTFSFEGLRRKI